MTAARDLLVAALRSDLSWFLATLVIGMTLTVIMALIAVEWLQEAELWVRGSPQPSRDR